MNTLIEVIMETFTSVQSVVDLRETLQSSVPTVVEE